jgi:hypothetical protein
VHPVQGDPNISAISHVIQLSIAPVFLLSAIGGMLGVMANRLSRVVDRARFLETRLEEGAVELEDISRDELASLTQRARLVSRAISFCTATALLVCVVIATLFLGAFLGVNTTVPVACFFVVAMVAFFLGLLSFLREVLLATASLRIGGIHVHSQRPFTPKRRP